MAYPARCENCTKYKPLNNIKGLCTHASCPNSAASKRRKKHEKCSGFISK